MNAPTKGPELILTRDCPALAVPRGMPVTLEAGRAARITQQLGGTFTVLVDGNLYRVAGYDADALGLETPASGPAAGGDGAPLSAETVEAEAWRVLATCYDPEIPIDIVNLGLVYACEVTPAEDGEGFRIHVRMTLTAPGCGMGTLIAEEVGQKLDAIAGVIDVWVELVWDPPWSRDMMSEAARLQLGLL
jgi:probable FeS assembly SUF system protein SufT